MPLPSLDEKVLLRPSGRPGRGSSPVWAETVGSGRHCRLELSASGGAPKPLSAARDAKPTGHRLHCTDYDLRFQEAHWGWRAVLRQVGAAGV